MPKMLLINIFLLINLALATDHKYLSIRVNQANFRKAPDLNATVSWDLEKYYPLKIKGQMGEWYEVVDYCGNEGWVHQITIDYPTKAVIVNGNNVNLRQAASLGSKVIGSTYKGEIFFIVNDHEDWVEVQSTIDDRRGYIYKKFLWGI